LYWLARTDYRLVFNVNNIKIIFSGSDTTHNKIDWKTARPLCLGCGLCLTRDFYKIHLSFVTLQTVTHEAPSQYFKVVDTHALPFQRFKGFETHALPVQYCNSEPVLGVVTWYSCQYNNIDMSYLTPKSRTPLFLSGSLVEFDSILALTLVPDVATPV